MADAEHPARPSRVELISTDPGFDPTKAGIEVMPADLAAGLTLGAVGSAYRVSTGGSFPTSFLRFGFDPNEAPWVDPFTIRLFHANEGARSFRPIWQSGANVGLGFIWGRVDGPGIYVAIGLPRDRLLLETLRQIAATRRMLPADPEQARRLTVEPVERLIDLGGDDLDELRDRLAGLEALAGADTFKQVTMPRGKDFGIAAPVLPYGVREFTGLRSVVARLTPTVDGLPEEQLFFPPHGSVPLPWPPVPREIPEFNYRRDLFRPLPPLVFDLMPWIYCVIRGTDWPMYMHDAEHTGRASCSSIDSTNVSTLRERFRVPVNGRVNSQPAIVGGRIYVGTMDASGTGIGGVLYKIRLSTGVIDGTFSVDDGPARQGKGIACTPAVVDGKIYFSAVNGKVYCVDAATMTQDWVVNLRKQDLAHNQPVDHGTDWATGWSSPVVANGFLYVGSGEGEHDTFGYVYCINIKNGQVNWLFCTDKFLDPNNPGNENQPNVIPPAHWIGGGLPPAPFIVAAANPAHPGSAPWSSAAYDAGLNRIYIGTGNADPDDPLPDPRYASGVISLDASTGEFKGYFQPASADSYRAGDLDVDTPGGPTIFTREWAGSFPLRQRLVGIGSKNGSYFLLDADGLALDTRRQLLPYDVNGNPFPNVDPPNNNDPRENKSGMFGTATVDPGRERLYIGLGGYSAAIDNTTTPFIRAMRWTDLADAWPTVGNNPPKYSMAEPPVYSTPGEAGLTNATSVNDVVFVGTTRPGFYAFHADTGLNLWSAPMFGPGSYCFGSAISGSYIVVGTGSNVYIYSL